MKNFEPQPPSKHIVETNIEVLAIKPLKLQSTLKRNL